jgi:tellurite resistance protein
MKVATPVTGAFLAVAFADGRYHATEENRFLGALANHKALAEISTVSLQTAYNTLTAEFRRDYPEAIAHVMESIKAVRFDAKAREAVKVAARAAVVADHVVTAEEELVLNRIAQALGLKVGDV